MVLEIRKEALGDGKKDDFDAFAMHVIMYVFTVLSGHGKSKVPKYLKPFTLKAIGVNGLNFLEDSL